MTREDVLRIVRDHRDELSALGVRELSLFGSFARGEEVAASDVDFLVDFDRKTFDAFMAVKELLEQLLGRNVDLVVRTALKPRLRDAILREAIRLTTKVAALRATMQAFLSR